MNWFEEQIAERSRLDDEALQNAYAHLAASVISSGHVPRFTLDDVAAADDALIACLRYHGAKSVQIPEDITDPSERMSYALSTTGVMKRPVRLIGHWWKDAAGAYLGSLKDGTPIALVPRKSRGYGYVDPATGSKVAVNATTAQNIAEDALCFYRPLPARELTLKDLVAFMLSTFDTYDYLLALGSSLFATLLGMLPIVATNLLYSFIIPAAEPSLILPICVLMLGTTLAQLAINATSAVIVSRLGSKLNVQVLASSMSRVILLPTDFFKNYAPGDLAMRTMSMASLIQTVFQTGVTSSLTSLFSLVYIVQMLMFAPSLALPALLVVLVELAVSVAVTLLTMKYNREQVQKNAALSGVTPALLNGIAKIKLAGAEKRAFARWAKAYAPVASATYKRPLLVVAGNTLVPVVAIAGTIVLYSIAASTGVSQSAYMTFNAAFSQVSGAMTALTGLATIMATLRPTMELVEPVLKAVPETSVGKRRVQRITGSIEVIHLSFKYVDDGPYVLKDISLRIKAGEYVAVVGRTGCGKSTLMRCLLGFEEPEKGTVLYSGQELSSVDVRSLRKHIGVVMQQSGLFQGDIQSNITISSPNATLEDAWEAAELAGVADDIRAMPMGMQTLVSEGGGGVSGGQRQRIMIARAVCSKPKILMFDEATSALDNVTQKHVSESLDGLKCTRIVIAHRLSTIRHADRILLLEDGAIVEDGTFEDLIAKGGKFAELVERQRLEGE